MSQYGFIDKLNGHLRWYVPTYSFAPRLLRSIKGKREDKENKNNETTTLAPQKKATDSIPSCYYVQAKGRHADDLYRTPAELG